jgi:ABC-type Zn uptake system ZnuABC Zn-binding protein ZnuA
LSAASLIFEHGLGLEAWLDRAYAASQSKARRVILSTGIEPRLGDEPGHRGEPDPHVWFDPNLVMVMVGNIRDALTETDPAGSDVYAANAERYLAHLRDLDTWIVEVVSTVPIRQRSLVTTHDTLAYFAQRYGFQVIGVVIPSLATDVEPSAQQIALLVTQIRSARVPAIFPENISDDRLMRRVASEANVRVGPELYTDALGQTGSRGETYLAMMRYNVASIMTALGGRLERN